jgi:phage/plasmid-like protein (TIGR03299 family)
MSKETREWLANNVLIGFTEKRGNAWHYREGDDNHYVGAVPVEDIMKRLFYWTPQEVPLYVPFAMEGTDAEPTMLEVPGRKAIIHPDTGHVLGVHKDSYNPHAFGEWLITNMGNALGALQVGSAGLLKGGAVAWVQAEMPDNMTTVDGVEFRPFFNGFTSLDGSFASTYKLGVTNVVCDNTMRAAQDEDTPQVKIKSTKNNKFQVIKVREALGLVHKVGGAFAEEAHRLCSTDFVDRQFEALVDQLAPHPGPEGSKRAVTLAENKRDNFWTLWREDERVAPWNGTAWGAYQAVNTYNQHVATVQNMDRAERNMLNHLSGKTDEQDAKTLELIGSLA